MSDTPTLEPASPPRPPAWIGWALAALLLFAVLFFAGKSFNVRNELQTALVAEQASRLEAGTLKNLLEAERLLSRAQLDRLAASEKLVADLREQSDLSRLAISALKSPAGAPAADAIAVWSADRRQGLIISPRLQAPAPDRRYWIWIKTPEAADPVDGGALSVDAGVTAFKSAQPVAGVPSFIITLESVDGAAKPTGPVVLSGE